MTRKWLAFVLPAVLLAAGPTMPVRAQSNGDKIKPVQEQLQQLDTSLKKAFDKIADEMKSLRDDLKSVREERADNQQKLQDAVSRIKSLDRTVADLKRDLEPLRTRPAVAPAASRDTLDDVRERLARIEKMLDRPLVPTRVALYPPVTGEAPDSRGEKTRQVREELERLDAAAKRGVERLRDDLDGLRRQIRECRDDRTTTQLRLQSALSTLGTLQPQLAEMKGELEALRSRPAPTVSLYPPAERAVLDDIRDRLHDIERRVERAPGPAYVALYPSRQTGRVVLVNTYPEALTFVVDGRSYEVGPGASLPLDGRPAGTFTYEVFSPTWGVRDRRTTTLGPNETITLTAR